MKPFNSNKEINDIDDFNEYASELWESFLTSFTKENKLIRDVDEDDMVDEGIDFIYTTRGTRLADRMRDRLATIGEAHFPNDWIEIESNYYIEQ